MLLRKWIFAFGNIAIKPVYDTKTREASAELP